MHSKPEKQTLRFSDDVVDLNLSKQFHFLILKKLYLSVKGNNRINLLCDIFLYVVLTVYRPTSPFQQKPFILIV